MRYLISFSLNPRVVLISFCSLNPREVPYPFLFSPSLWGAWSLNVLSILVRYLISLCSVNRREVPNPLVFSQSSWGTNLLVFSHSSWGTLSLSVLSVLVRFLIPYYSHNYWSKVPYLSSWYLLRPGEIHSHCLSVMYSLCAGITGTSLALWPLR